MKPTLARTLVLGAVLAWRPLTAAVATPETIPPPGRTVEKITTLRDKGQQYALFLPPGYGDPQKRWPILFVLDPRGRAVPGIERFLPAAARHGWLIMSSYQSRSDTLASVNTRAMEALLREAQARYLVDTRRFYLAGMSGTAHAAWRLAQQLEPHVAGIIAVVGGVQEATQGPPGDASFAYYGITSEIDFNYQEMMRLEEHLLAAGVDHRIDFFSGRHGWSPAEHTNRAVDWLAFQAVKRGLAPSDEGLIDDRLAKARSAAASARGPVESLRRNRDIVRDFGEMRDVGTAAEAVTKLERSPELAGRRRQNRKLAKQEETYLAQRFGTFLVEIESPGRRPPTLAAARVSLQLARLASQAGDQEQPIRARSARRIQESIYSALAYYLPEKFESRGDLERAALALELATEIFRDAARAHWRLAEVYARAGRKDKAFEALRDATSLGSVDVERLETDPTWAALRDRPEWRELLAGLGSG